MFDTRISDEAFEAIKKYCTDRNYKCNGCMYRIDKVTKEHSKLLTCIFANCPCSWEVII